MGAFSNNSGDGDRAWARGGCRREGEHHSEFSAGDLRGGLGGWFRGSGAAKVGRIAREAAFLRAGLRGLALPPPDCPCGLVKVTQHL